MASQWAIQDGNRFPAILGHSGTAGTAETLRVVADTSGNLMVNTGGVIPTTGNNPSITISRNASNYIGTLAQVIGGTTYTKTITRDSNNYIINLSAWS